MHVKIVKNGKPPWVEVFNAAVPLRDGEHVVTNIVDKSKVAIGVRLDLGFMRHELGLRSMLFEADKLDPDGYLVADFGSKGEITLPISGNRMLTVTAPRSVVRA